MADIKVFEAESGVVLLYPDSDLGAEWLEDEYGPPSTDMSTAFWPLDTEYLAAMTRCAEGDGLEVVQEEYE